MKGGAIFDQTRNYRYLLWRSWDETLPKCGLIMLNPSTADGTVNDPTIRKSLSLAQHWGYGSLLVGNLFAYRTPYPKLLRQAKEPIGCKNDEHLLQLAKVVDCLVLAWGNQGIYLGRSHYVQQLLSNQSPMFCLGRTRLNEPRHPLYIKAQAQLISF